MNSTELCRSGGKENGWLALPLFLLSVFPLAGLAVAGDVNVTGTVTSTGVTMDQAVADVNAGRGAGANVTVTINGDQSAAGASVDNARWSINGMDTPTNYNGGIPIPGFGSVSVVGGGGVRTLSVSGTNAGSVLRIINARDNIIVDSIRVTGGSIFYGTDANHGEIGGGGLMLGSHGGLGTDEGYAANVIAVNNVEAIGNSLTVGGATAATGNAFGGGVYVAGIGGGMTADPAYGRSAVSFTTVNLKNNSINFTNTAGDASVRGGGAHVSYAQSFSYTGGEVSGNAVVLNNGGHAGGGGLSVDSSGGFGPMNISNVQFENNRVTMNGSILANGYARGGGLYFLGQGATATAININNQTSFSDNQAIATGTNVHAMGGAAHFMIDNANVTFTGTSFSVNKAISDSETAMGGAVSASIFASDNNGSMTFNQAKFNANVAQGADGAMGGAVYTAAGIHFFIGSTFTQNLAESGGDVSGGALHLNARTGLSGHSISGSTFTGNTARATGWFSGSAEGGAVYLESGNHALTNNTFQGNAAEASDDVARGGALMLAGGNTTVTGGSFSQNRAVSDDAVGGAVYLKSGTLTMTNASVTDNTAIGSGAMGGAIFVSTAETNPSKLVLEATANNNTVISGNRANGYSSGIYFGREGAASSQSNAELEIAGAGKVTINDPMTVKMNNVRNFTMTKSGSGELAWNGANNFTTDGATTTIDLRQGKVTVGDQFTARGVTQLGETSNFVVKIGSSTLLSFSTTRDQNLAIFDFSNNGNRTFDVSKGATLTTTLGREIISKTWKFKIASGLADAELQVAKNNFNFVQTGDHTNLLGLAIEGDSLYATVGFRSPFEGTGRNPKSALPGLDSLFKANNGLAVSDAEYLAILDSPYGVTPELYMDQAHIMMNATDLVARHAIDFGARFPYRERMRMEASSYQSYPSSGVYEEYQGSYDAYPSLAICNNDSGVRIWGGYIGDLNRRDSHSGYQGYKVERHGFVLGVNYDFSANGTLGFYGGYTNAESKGRLSDTKIEQDVGHFGFIARISPLTAAPEFSIYADAGYHFAYNDFHRKLGQFRAEDSFDQEVYTGGLGLEYMFAMGGFNLTPHLEARYINLEHHALSESGTSATIAHVDGINKGSFNTRLGIEFSRDFQLACGVFTPALNVSWKHEYGDRQFWSNGYYMNDPSRVYYSLSNAPLNRDSADIGLSLKTLYQYGPKTTFGFNLAYNLNISRRSNVHSIYAGFDLGF